jgi:hypothetical protein
LRFRFIPQKSVQSRNFYEMHPASNTSVPLDLLV